MIYEYNVAEQEASISVISRLTRYSAVPTKELAWSLAVFDGSPGPLEPGEVLDKVELVIHKGAAASGPLLSGNSAARPKSAKLKNESPQSVWL